MTAPIAATTVLVILSSAASIGIVLGLLSNGKPQ